MKRRPTRFSQDEVARLWQRYHPKSRPEVLLLFVVFSVLALAVMIGLSSGSFGAPKSLGLVCVVACLALALHRWDWTMLVAVAGMPFSEFYAPVVGKSTMSFWEVATLCAIFGWLLNLVRTKTLTRAPVGEKLRFQANLVDLGMLMSMGVQVLGNFVAYTNSGDIRLNIKPFEYGFGYFLARGLVRDKSTARAFLIVVVWSALIQAVIGSLQHFDIVHLRTGTYDFPLWPRSYLHHLTKFGPRMVILGSGTFGHFLTLGFFLSLCLPCAMVLAIDEKMPEVKLFWIAAGAFIFYGLLLSYARAGLGGAILIAILLLFLIPRGRWVSPSRTVAVGLILFSLVAWYWANHSEYSDTLNVEIRENLWRDLLEGFPANKFELIFGRGEEASRLRAEKVFHMRGAHNGYIQVYMDYGLVGISSLVLILIGMLLPLRAIVRARNIGFWEACAAAGATGFVSLYVEAYMATVWTLIGFQPFYMAMAALSHARVGNNALEEELEGQEPKHPPIRLSSLSQRQQHRVQQALPFNQDRSRTVENYQEDANPQ